MLLPSRGALHSPLWFSSCCFTEAHRNLLSLCPQLSERFVLVLSWGKRLWELQTSFSRACARELVFVQTALYRIVSHCYCLQKSCAKTPWLQICVTVLKYQGKSCLKQYTVLSMHALSNPLSTLHRLLPYSKHRMSTFQINTEIPFDTVNCSSKHGSYCSPTGGDGWTMRRMLLQLPHVAINNTMHGAATVIFLWNNISVKLVIKHVNYDL